MNYGGVLIVNQPSILPESNPVMSLSVSSLVFRLLLSMLCAAVIGYGRSKRGRAAGLRTYMLISIGAAMSVLITQYLYVMLHTDWLDVVEAVGEKFDAARMASQVFTGIGFLGAGIIIKASHQQVKGLTTATGLFATVAMGMACGVGFYPIVFMSMVATVLVLNVITPLEAAFKRRLRNITLNVEFDSVEHVETIADAIRAQDALIYDIDIEHMDEENQSPSAIFILKLSKENHSHSSMITTIAELDCVSSVQELIA